MKISLNWLKEIIDLSHISTADLTDKLTLSGFEVDNIEYLYSGTPKEDIILEIAITANRGDTFSLLGLAREIAALYDLDFKPQLNEADISLTHAKETSLLDLEDCSFYCIGILRNVTITVSPMWLQEYLCNLGIEPKNSIEDILNYILIKYGQPIAIYDEHKVRKLAERKENPSLEFTIASSEKKSLIYARNREKYVLNSENLVTKVNGYPIAVTGIIESDETNINFTTSSLILEMAVIPAQKIRRSCLNLNLKTEASMRFERGIDLSLTKPAYHKAIELITELTHGQLVSVNYKEIDLNSNKSIRLSYLKIQDILGNLVTLKNLSRNRIQSILERLDFQLVSTNEGWLVTVPPHRLLDIEKDIDLIEEIGRVHGFDNFLNIFPEHNTFNSFSIRNRIIRQLRIFFLTKGFNELLHYSFQETCQTGMFTNQIQLVNPLTVDQGALRDSILSNLLDSYKYNLSQGNGALNGFEIGRVFSKEKDVIIEEDFLSCIWGGHLVKSSWSDQAKFISWFEAKGLIENVFRLLNISVQWSKRHDLKYLNRNLLHKYRWAIVESDGMEIGIFAQIHPKHTQKLNHNIYVFEVNLERIISLCKNQKSGQRTFNMYSTYPIVYRDINIEVSLDVTVESILQAVSIIRDPLFESMHLFDEYQEIGVKDKRRLSFRLFYRSFSETLKLEQVETLTEEIKQIIHTKFSIAVEL